MTEVTRRTFMSSIGAGALGLGAMAQSRVNTAGATTPAGYPHAGRNSNEGRRPHVIVFFTDDQSAHLGCLGTPGIATPHIDGLAREGVLFDNGFASSASCAPSRCALLTGMHCHANGVWRNVHTPTIDAPEEDLGPETRFREIEPVGVHEDIPTLPELLNEAGYYTGITDKFHLSPMWKFPFQHRYTNTVSDEIKAAFRQFLDARDDRPFFIMANINWTHRPFMRPAVERWDLPLPDTAQVDVPGYLADTPLMRADLAEYYHTVELCDLTVAAYLEVLEEMGLYEDTLLFFTSDQGFCYHRAKATAYDKGIRVPFIVKPPAAQPARHSRALVSHLDIMPTILDYAEVDIPDGVHGQSLRPLLTAGDDPLDWRDYVFAEHNAHGPNPLEYYPTRAVWDGRFHYIRHLMHERTWDGDPASLLDMDGDLPAEIMFAGPADAFPTRGWGNRAYEAAIRGREAFPVQYRILESIFRRDHEELYDLHTDPEELHNLAEDAPHQDHLRRLRAAVDAWMDETDDPGIETRNVPRRTGDG